MAIHWQIKFRSLRANTLYTVNIYDANYSSTPVELIGGAQPFVTDEDDDDDFFAPIRTQSGYVRIVDTGKDKNGNTFSWRNLIPTTDTDRPVTLTDGRGAVVWMGFMQAQNFSGRLYEVPQEREFPVQCPLATVSRDIVDPSNPQIRNFAYVLHEVLRHIPDPCKPTHIIIQGGSDALDWMKKQVDWSLFVDTDTEGNAIGRYDLETVLSDMCKYWGLTARMCGAKLYLTCADEADETDALCMTYSQFATLAGSGSATVSIESMFTENISVGNVFASTENNDLQNRGPNMCTVEIQTNDEGSTVVDIFDNELVKDMKRGTWAEGATEHDGSDYWHYSKDITTRSRYDLYAYCYGEAASFNILSKSEGENGYNNVGNVIRIKKSYSGINFVELHTRYEHCFANGFLRFRGTTYRKGVEYQNRDHVTYAGNPDMVVRLGIGRTRSSAQWWNGKQWQSSQCTFRLSLGNGKDEFFTRYYVGSVFDPNFYQTSIIETTNQTGIVYIDLLGCDNSDGRMSEINGERRFDLKDFRLEFFKNDNVGKTQHPNSRWWDVEENLDVPDLKYKAHNNNMVKQDYSVEAQYGSNNGVPPSYGLLINTDGTWMQSAKYANGTKDERPETHLCNRIVGYWETSKRRIECELRKELITDINPRTKLAIDGTTLYPLSVSHDWRDDVVRIMAMEI